MNTETIDALPELQKPQASNAMRNADRAGVIASVLCAIHCAAAPLLLLIMPAFGEIWAHPATHWGMALFVIPVAVLMMSKGYKRHRRSWIIAIGIAGILLVMAGAAAPYFESTPTPAPPAAGAEASGCTDTCCPSVVTEETGEKRLHIPLASILTTAGGLFLIGTHVGNLCCCPGCKRKSKIKA